MMMNKQEIDLERLLHLAHKHGMNDMSNRCEVCQEMEDLKSDTLAKLVRYDALQDRYLNQNEKHFGELCGTYFNDYPMENKNG